MARSCLAWAVLALITMPWSWTSSMVTPARRISVRTAGVVRPVISYWTGRSAVATTVFRAAGSAVATADAGAARPRASRTARVAFRLAFVLVAPVFVLAFAERDFRVLASRMLAVS
ncbi:hypothetical protein SCYAM73S_02845 [Streptomyces cyaneofuscatus]